MKLFDAVDVDVDPGVDVEVVLQLEEAILAATVWLDGAFTVVVRLYPH